jgi:AcrR family transcriptional regulator
MKKPKKRILNQTHRPGREAWIHAAHDALLNAGIESVKVERLAKSLKASRTAFYYHFKNRAELLNELLTHWIIHNTHPFEQLIEDKGRSWQEEFEHLFMIWLDEKDYSHTFDSAVRDWARISKHVAKVVRRIDRKRISIIKRIFIDMGFGEDEAFIRARVTYFTQVGYYTIGLEETKTRRLELWPMYEKVLTAK